jgi:hypothetical protein
VRLPIVLLLGLLLCACSGGNTPAEPTAATGGTYTVNVSGAVQTNFSGTTSYLFSESEEGVADLLIIFNIPDNSDIVNIGLPSAPAVGTYTIDQSGESTASPIMSYARVSEGNEVSVYDAVQGELVIESADPLTGSFEFSGQNINGEEVGVNGTFNGLPRGEYPTLEAPEESEE